MSALEARLRRLSARLRPEPFPGMRALVEAEAAAHGLDPGELMAEAEAILAESRRRGETLAALLERLAAECGTTVECLRAEAVR